MAKNWKHTKKLLEDLLCDKLKGALLTSSTATALTMIGLAILRLCWIKSQSLGLAAVSQKIRTIVSLCQRMKFAAL